MLIVLVDKLPSSTSDKSTSELSDIVKSDILNTNPTTSVNVNNSPTASSSSNSTKERISASADLEEKRCRTREGRQKLGSAGRSMTEGASNSSDENNATKANSGRLRAPTSEVAWVAPVEKKQERIKLSGRRRGTEDNLERKKKPVQETANTSLPENNTNEWRLSKSQTPPKSKHSR